MTELAAASLYELRLRYQHIKEEHGPGGHAQMAFEHLFRESYRLGQPLDSLDTHLANEEARFMSQVIRGVDGHMYWNGAGKDFSRNDGGRRTPRRWWWVHVHGDISSHTVISPSCGESACIAPGHCEAAPRATNYKYTKEQMLNAVKVAALRLGRPPTSSEWDKLGYRPSLHIFRLRFGPWRTVIELAGLPYSAAAGRPASPDDCVRSLQLVMREVGHRHPTRNDFDSCRQKLHDAGLPSRSSTVRKHLGPWHLALVKARP